MRWNPFKQVSVSSGKKEHLLYSIDAANTHGITGWCFDFHHPENPVRLCFFMDDRKIGGTDATDYREDVKSYNLHPTGRCGFEFRLPRNTPIRKHQFLNVCVHSSQNPLVQIPTDQIPVVMEGALPKLFFMHIPKTAGTSFNAFCRLHFPNDKTAIHIESRPASDYPVLTREKNYLSGHLTLKQLREGFDLSAFDLLTLLREPLHHLHSHINWVKSIAADPAGGFFIKHHPAVQKAALKLKQIDFSDKPQLRRFVKTLSGIEIDFFDNLQTRYFLEYRPEKVTREDLEQAEKNLRRFRIIGTTEYYHHYIDHVCKTYRMEKILPPVFNTSTGKKLFSLEDPEVRLILNPLVESDLLLYQRIRQSMHPKEGMS